MLFVILLLAFIALLLIYSAVSGMPINEVLRQWT